MDERVSVLYAEDERIVRKQFARLLSRSGYDVRAVNNGADAVADFVRRRSDVVVLDVMMPLMSGRDACLDIRKVDPDVPIIFLTALDSEIDELEGLSVGADDYVSKTASDDVFLARVAAAARRVRKPQSAGFLFGTGRVDSEASVFVDGDASSRLSVREVELLRLLHDNPNRILTKDFLQTRLFGVDYAGDLRSFDKTIERLRAKLSASSVFLRTIPRQGVEYDPPK